MTGVLVSGSVVLVTVSEEVSPVATVKAVPVVVKRVTCVVVVHKVSEKRTQVRKPPGRGESLK